MSIQETSGTTPATVLEVALECIYNNLACEDIATPQQSLGAQYDPNDAKQSASFQLTTDPDVIFYITIERTTLWGSPAPLDPGGDKNG